MYEKMKTIYFLLIFILNIFNIYSIDFTTYKINSNINNYYFKTKILSLLYIQNITLNNNNFISNITSNDGLYSVNLNIGTPMQKFHLLLDTGSPLLWVNSNDCFGCKSKNRFIQSLSNTFNYTHDIININYLSGKISGISCKDTIKFNNYMISNFNFILVNETTINNDLEGIFGLSKGIKDFQHLKYSVFNQILDNGFIKEKIFLFDFSHNKFFIGEKPSYLNNYENFTCISLKGNIFNNYYWHCSFEEIKYNNNELISTHLNKNHSIIFDSGTNSLIFPINYISSFEKIILDNKLLNNFKCSIQIIDENNIYSFVCNKNISNLINEEKEEYQNIYYNNEFITIYLNNDKKIIFKLSDLYNKDDANFRLFFTITPNNAIILGVPFFEKYIILFNKDNGEVIIYNEIIENKNPNLLLKILIGILIGIIIIIILLLIYHLIIRKKNKITSNQIEKQFSNFGIFTPEIDL